MSFVTWSPDKGLEGISLKDAGLVTTTTNGTGVKVGKGKYRLVVNITAIDADASDDLYFIAVQANTADASTTWKEVTPKMGFGNSTTTGDSATDTADEFDIIIDNPEDYQLRIRTIVVGTVTTGINYTAKLHRVISQQ